MIEALFFYVFSAVLVASAAMVIAARNPVNAVLFLILAFFNAAGLFVLLGAEFIAMTLVIVYVGAVAVLFLFVVMMLDIDLKKSARMHLPIGGLVGAALLAEIVWMYLRWAPSADAASRAVSPMPEGVSNTQALGEIIYTQYVFPFQLAGLILLVAMVGAITLTLRERSGVRHQNVSSQVSRRAGDAFETVKVPVGQGVAL